MSLIKKMKSTKRAMSLALSLSMIVSMLPGNLSLVDVKAADDNTPYVVSLGRPAYASSEVGQATADKVVDGDFTTRWEGNATDPQWIYVDLGKETQITGLYLKWEAAYAKSYKVQFSNDEENWEDVFIRGNAGSGDGEVVQQPISISYSVTDNGISANWTSVDNANYKVCIDNDNNVAVAPDGYKFSNHVVNNGLIKLDEGTYELIVIAINKETGAEISRGTKTIYVTHQEVTTEAEGPTTAAKVTDTEATIDVSGTARYVRLYMTERGTNWGYSLYEMQVYGLDGLVQRPVDYGENIALNKPVDCSGMRDVWWLYEDGVLNQDTVRDSNAVDGDYNTSFTSAGDDNQWIYVDLEQTTEIGRVVINWTSDAGKAYDIQVSNDATNWQTVYRRLNGYTSLRDDVPVYANARYVRVYGYSRVENGSGFGISELEVYKYITGEEKKQYQISELPETQIINTVGGSYITNDLYLETAKLPTYIDTENVTVPISSNDWWQSCIIKQFGNTMSTLPFKTGYSKKGLSVLTMTDGWLPTPGETDVNISVVSESTPDFYVLPENVDTNTAYDRLHKNSDYAAELQLMDANGVVMTSTHIKGSPYIFCDFGTREKVYINIPNLTDIYDDNGTSILPSGSTITADHIGIEVTDTDNEEKTNTSKSYYALNFPAGTTIKNSNGTLKVTFASDKYMSIGTMLSKSDLNTYYQHGYAFVTDSKVTYSYNDTMSRITSNYTVTTELKRARFSNTTMQLMLPHQWKYATQKDDKVAVYPSIRGDMYALWSNSFTTVDTFEGLLPTFAIPTNNEFDHAKVISYLRTLENATAHINPAADAYWEGKNVHPLGMGVLMADQLGETELRDIFLERLKERLVDWFTYSGPDDISYFIYDEHWGTLYYKASEFGANTGICDHHFTYGYFLFGAAVLATYDNEFYEQYKDFVEILMRDYANPSDNDSEYCKFRAYDLYEGHSWAGGYADNDNGNNQESASESLFSWVGMYMWGVLTENDTWRDAGVFGFTNEMEAVEQYWFDYDKQNWVEDWPYDCVAQIYGAQNFFGTFFGGQPLYCYGIQWLPISEYLTYYGMNQERAAEIYAGLERDTEDALNKAVIVWRNEGKSEEEIQEEIDKYPHQDTGWQHITWPFLSQTDPDRALGIFIENDTKVQTTDQANTYWFINAMKQYGYKAADVVATGDLCATVYYNENTNKYTANAWNPTDKAKEVSFIEVATGNTLGTATIGAKSLVKFEVDKNNTFAYTQAATPTFKTTGLADGVVKNNVSGKATYGDTQLVELATETDGATIYYTTDGSVPTTDSNVYTGTILVSSDTVIKAIAAKEGCINSSYASLDFTIEGDSTAGTENLALNKDVVASSQGNENSGAKMTDGNYGTRWESDFEDDEWVYVDLGSEQYINSVKIFWEAAAAGEYEIQISTDASNWTTVAKVTNSGAGEKATEFAAVSARYVKMVGLSRVTAYGYSIYEFEVYGAVQASAPSITPEGGIFDSAQTVTLSTTVKGAEIKYTTDGTEPTEDSPSYIAPFTVDKSTVVKAATFRKGMTLSDVATASIIIKGTVAISNATLVVAEGHTKKLTAISDKTVTWSSSNTSVAYVDQNGNVSGLKQGTAIITASVGTGSATCTVTVAEAVPLTSVTLDKTEMTIKVKDSTTLVATYAPANTTDDTDVTWVSSDPSVATVTNGKVVAKKEGTTVISATIAGITASCTLTVEPKFTTKEKFVNTEYNAMLTADIFQSGKFEGDVSALKDKIGFLGTAGGNWASQTVNSTCGPLFLIADLSKAYTLNQIEAMHIEWKNNDQTLPTDGFKILVCDDANYNTVVGEDGVTVTSDNSTWTTVFDSEKNQATNTTGGYDWVVDEVGCYSVLPMVNSNYGKTFNHVKIEFINNGASKPWGIQAYEIALLTNDEEQNVSGGEDPTVEETTTVTETTTEKETTTEDSVEKPVTPFGVIVSSENANEISVVMGNPGNGQTFDIYIDGILKMTGAQAAAHTFTNVAPGTHTVKLVGVLNGYESSPYETTITVEGTESETEINSDGIVVSNKVEINGFQVSSTVGGIRTVYSVDSSIDSKEVVERGLVYGLEKYCQSKNVVVGSDDPYVHSYAATSAGKLSTAYNEKLAESYVMTMKQNFDKLTTEGFTTNYYVRAYVKLSDGTYVYSEIEKYSAYSVADKVYQNCGMVNEEGHNYLYNTILKKVDSSYTQIAYDSSKGYVTASKND